jgi:hypothetical protein
MKMDKIILALSLVLVSYCAQAQQADSLFADNDPLITEAESVWLNENFNTPGFDFRNKYIHFVDLQPGGYLGIGKWQFALKKTDLGKVELNKSDYTLFVLDSVERESTRGYDAILVIARKRNKGKLKRLTRERIVSRSTNRYPRLPKDAGLDSNALLSSANAAFFNALYNNPDNCRRYDFTGKKIAIFSTHGQIDKIVRIGIPEYVRRIKSQLYDYGTAMSDFTYILTAEQKKETGGYDVIIQYQYKKDLPLAYLLSQLKQKRD